jgi:hypothetical protein
MLIVSVAVMVPYAVRVTELGLTAAVGPLKLVAVLNETVSAKALMLVRVRVDVREPPMGTMIPFIGLALMEKSCGVSWTTALAEWLTAAELVPVAVMRNAGNRLMELPFTSQPEKGSGATPAVKVVVADPPEGRKRLESLTDTVRGGKLMPPIGLPLLQSKLGGVAPMPDTAAMPMVSEKPPWLVSVTVKVKLAPGATVVDVGVIAKP